MNLIKIILIIIAGIFAGFINVMAAGGSLITLPVLILCGLPSAVANGTNRIALMVQNIIAVGNYKHKGIIDLKLAFIISIPAIIGSLLGARLAIFLPDNSFNKILAVVMLIMLAIILLNPTRRFSHITENLTRKRMVVTLIVFFFIGIYGGFIQAGVGFFIITALTLLTGMSLVKINSIKSFVVGIYMVSSLLVFIFSGNINWLLGILLAVGNGFGAWLASNLAIKKGERLIKIILVFAVILMAGNLILISL